jgi:D-alanine--poly(phosphoribitol) ligase subunit 1
MGYRIELEEIEAALNSLSYVAQSAVVYERTHVNYGKIIAFVATAENIDEASIKNALENLLPYYMIPNVIELRSFLPINKNGKVDKKNITTLLI